MSQVSVTVTMDSRMKEQIDQFCAMSGNTQEQTFDEMMRMWERIVFVPWTELSPPATSSTPPVSPSLSLRPKWSRF